MIISDDAGLEVITSGLLGAEEVWVEEPFIQTSSPEDDLVAKTRKNKPDILLVPDALGVEKVQELATAIRADITSLDHGRQICILLYGDKSRGLVRNALRTRVDDYLELPFTSTELLFKFKAFEDRMQGLVTNDALVLALARLAEARDHCTGGHLRRVSEYCRELSVELMRIGVLPQDISADFPILMYRTSPLHDIGKVNTPDSILLKNGPLSPDERKEMEKHVLCGSAVLQTILGRYPASRFYAMATEIALTHHEHYDGKGYPQGLRGNEIPWSGRIMAVADVYDALTVVRPYKEPFSHDETVRKIDSERGTHFDPVIVDVFDVLSDRFREIHESCETSPHEG